MLETNLDDVPARWSATAIERLFAAGALDVFAMPIQMKKNRPGVLLSVICEREKAARAGSDPVPRDGDVRRPPHHGDAARSCGARPSTVQTPWGPVKAKRGWREDGFEVLTPEYEDCARVAGEHGVPLRDVYDGRASADSRE